MARALSRLIQQQAAAAGCDLGPEQVQQVEVYLSLLQRWGQRINLTANPDATWVVRQHLPDTFQLASLVQQDEFVCQSYLDAGSGAGITGVVLQIIRPVPVLTLVEANGKKCSFLRTAVHELKLDAQVLQQRMEALEPQTHQLVCSRATWGPRQWLQIARPWVDPRGRVAVFSSQAVVDGSGHYQLDRQQGYRLHNDASRMLSLFSRRACST